MFFVIIIIIIALRRIRFSFDDSDKLIDKRSAGRKCGSGF